ncbi:MAG: ATP-dependent DNA helicase RecQ [Candidatus Acidiferrales bacterium]
MASEVELLAALKRYWGHSAFRPLQDRIVRSLLAGRDTCVVMPTGGGKSLCYQLPAALSPGQTVLVISPLMALMQDQVAQLGQMGIPAAFLNSSLGQREQSEIVKRAGRGEYRLLYISPERLARADTHAWLQTVPISLFAIDEAHCISEWGHEFRPEYRLLSGLRERFPEKPIAAFTASATKHVRHDIIAQLKLRAPDKYIASFHRANLRYVVHETSSARQQELLLRALRHYAGQSVIVYAPTIARVEETVESLQAEGFPAIGYHGKMNAADRTKSHESWMADDENILVGTVAFGMGINKSAVRAVIHLSLPKSIEQFYQEAGRAGRDEQPADCVMLWQKRDAGLLAHFAQQITDRAERNRAWDRYNEIRGFVDSTICRHLQICAHFGETKKWESCGACDVCGYLPAWWTREMEKPRASRRKSKPKRTKPATVSTPPKFPERAPAHYRPSPPIARPAAEMQLEMKSPPSPRTTRGAWWGAAKPNPSGSAPGASNGLRAHLREWRRAIAKEQNIAAFIVMHDTTLDALCEIVPRSMHELLSVPGIGEIKAERYGEQILEVIRNFRPDSAPAASPAA